MKASHVLIGFKLVCLFLLISEEAFALVDMRTSNYAETFTLAQIKSSQGMTEIEVSYNSRSLYDGLFGFGWCSVFETKIAADVDGSISLINCGSGQENRFVPRNPIGPQIEDAADFITKKYQLDFPSTSLDVLQNMKQRLRDDSSYRLQWAKRVRYATEALFLEPLLDQTSADSAVFDGHYYVVHVGLSTLTFDRDGRLLRVKTSDRSGFSLTYSDGKISTIEFETGLMWVASYDAPGRLQSLRTTSEGKPVDLMFSIKDKKLVSWKNYWGNTYSFHYDANLNLTKIDYPDNTTKELTYDEKKDLVLSFQDRSFDGEVCIERYSYEVDPLAPTDHYWADAVKECSEKVTSSGRFEFWHSEINDGTHQKYLRRVRTKLRSKNDAEEIKDTEYYPNGQPMWIENNGVRNFYRYDASGRVRTMLSKDVLFEFSFDHNCGTRKEMDEFKFTVDHTTPIKIIFSTDPISFRIIGFVTTSGLSAKIFYDEDDLVEVRFGSGRRFIFEKPSFTGIITAPDGARMSIPYREIRLKDRADSPVASSDADKAFVPWLLVALCGKGGDRNCNQLPSAILKEGIDALTE